jgi:hypothetical protein
MTQPDLEQELDRGTRVVELGRAESESDHHLISQNEHAREGMEREPAGARGREGNRPAGATENAIEEKQLAPW